MVCRDRKDTELFSCQVGNQYPETDPLEMPVRGSVLLAAGSQMAESREPCLGCVWGQDDDSCLQPVKWDKYMCFLLASSCFSVDFRAACEQVLSLCNQERAETCFSLVWRSLAPPGGVSDSRSVPELCAPRACPWRNVCAKAQTRETAERE